MPNWKKVIVSGSDASLNSLNVVNGITGSLFGTSSYAVNADLLDGLNSTVFATTGSNTFIGNQTITGSLTISSSAAIELIVVGNSVFTGSIDIVGNNNNIVSPSVTGSNTLRFVDTDTTTIANQQIGKIEFFSSDITAPGGSVKAYILASAEDTSPDAYVSIGTDSTTGTATEKLKISSTGNVTITTGSLSVSGSAAITGSLTVSGSASITGPLSVSGSLRVVNSATITGSLVTTTQLINGIRVGQGPGDTTNTAVGFGALGANTTGQYNTSIGAETMAGSTGSRNTALGYRVLYGVNANENYSDDVAIGYNAGYFGSNGSNVLIGSLAGSGGSDGSSITKNVYIGYNAGGNNSSGDSSQGNVYIGYNAGFGLNQSNTLIINNQSGSNPLIRGDFSGSLRFNTPLGTSITGSLTVFSGSAIDFQVTDTGTKIGNLITDIHTVTGSLNISGSVFITSSLGVGVAPSATVGRIDASNDVVAFSTSDIRFKENITPIPNALDKLNKIGGYTFDWNSDPELTKLHGFKGHDIGVIAQEIEKVLPELVTTRDNGYKAVKYEKLVALLIESNKELLKRIEVLESKINQ